MRIKQEVEALRQQLTVERALQSVTRLNTTLSQVSGGKSDLLSVDEGLPDVSGQTAAAGEWVCGDPVGAKPT